MKILVISDSHGNLVNINHVLGFAKKYGVSAVIHAGDWNTTQAVDAVLSFEIPLFTVLGNADVWEDTIQKLKVKSQKFSEDFLEFELGRRNIGITHKPSNNKRYFFDKKLDVIFNGHLHSKDESIVNGTKIVRPGAIVNGNNFAIYDTKTNRVEFVADDQI